MGKKGKKKFRIRHMVLLLFAIYICSTVYSQRNMMKELEIEKNNTEEEIEKLKSEINDINIEIQNKDSLEFVEKIAREEFRMLKPREIIYIDKNKNKNPFLRKDNN